MKDGDTLLLCSDGLTTMISDEEIASTLRSSGSDLAQAARALIDQANDHGGEDNITVILLKFEE
jgi:serine/threonine protein phosphatase PrpC